MLPWPGIFESCYRVQREGVTKEDEITNTQDHHEYAAEQKEPVKSNNYSVRKTNEGMLTNRILRRANQIVSNYSYRSLETIFFGTELSKKT